MTSLHLMRAKAAEHPEQFWAPVADSLRWQKPYEQALDRSKAPFYRWFCGGEFNICDNAIDRHVDAGRGDQLAIIVDSSITGRKEQYTYNQLLDEVSRLAGVLSNHGVNKGDRVVVYMPMLEQALFAMLACARLGAIHSVVFGGFSAKELGKRIDDAKPKMLLTASCGIEPKGIIEYMPIVRKALEQCAHHVDSTLVWQRKRCVVTLESREYDWREEAANADPVGCTWVRGEDPLYILYTSGTTGKPKGVQRGHADYATGLVWSMENIYNIHAGDVFWSASDVGWVVGHSYICYAPLLAGATTVVYEGKPVGTPDAGAFWRVIADYGVKSLFTAPTAIRAIRREDSQGKLVEQYDLSKLESVFLAGEHSDAKTLDWVNDKLGVPVIDHWWQTETGWPITACFMGIDDAPYKPFNSGLAVPGHQVCALDDRGHPVGAHTMGNIAIRLPMAPGTLQTLWLNDERCEEAYFSQYPGYYLTGDSGHYDEDGFWHVMGRIDDVINVAGHRLSTGEMEEILSEHPDVAEVAVIGVKNRLKGQVPIGFIVKKSTSKNDNETIKAQVIEHMRDALGALAVFKLVTVVDKLPKTRSGKILRATMRSMADDTPYDIPATIEDPHALDIIKAGLRELGYPRNQELDISIVEHQTKDI
ncbi:AMP-binding protein [Suttonella sp. R2A3]|uniref:AMP-binding protein n=1 Tax=Suttonella sp. R2A3 TaxID=2908648 RepID=UPI001F3346C9|nr:AMP-binding protein [Suttonella sp. R2A3]UJF23788.1 AMP-binding protein [Suttonella sp. R2A3]